MNADKLVSLRSLGIKDLEDPEYELLLGQIFVEGLDTTLDFFIDLLRAGAIHNRHRDMIDELLERHNL